MTRDDLADFIRRYAAGDTEPHEWQKFAIQHYADIETEHARVRLVRLALQQDSMSPIGIESDLQRIADVLMLPVEPATFYFRDGAAGILKETLPLTDNAIVAYEPYRSGAHFDMHEALRSGSPALCKYMHEDRCFSFTVIDAPEYGRLRVQL